MVDVAVQQQYSPCSQFGSSPFNSTTSWTKTFETSFILRPAREQVQPQLDKLSSTKSSNYLLSVSRTAREDSPELLELQAEIEALRCAF